MSSAHGAVLLFLVAQAAASDPQVSRPVFEAGTELVTVDVVVVDAKGEPVVGLTRSDFQVQEDGQAREIATFEEVRLAEARPAQASTVPPVPDRPRTSTNSGPVPPRTFVIVFDEQHLTPAGAGRARKAIASFLQDGTRDGDRVMLVPTSAGRSWTDTMPQGRADLLALLETMAGRASANRPADHLTDWEAIQIHVNRSEPVKSTVLRRFYENGAIPPCMPPPGTSDPCTEKDLNLEGSSRVTMRAAEVYSESVQRRRATLNVLEALMETLVPIKSRKSVLLVSEGFVLEPALLEMHGVYDAARRANTAINFVDARGLAPVETTVVEDGRATQQSGSFSSRPSNDLGLALDQPRLLSEGSEAVAAETGGETFRNSNDIRAGFDRLARESAVYYLVGYAPGDLKRDGRFRRIAVAVARPGTKVRARRGYVVPRESDLRRAGNPAPRPLGDRSTVPLRLAAYTLEDTAKGTVRVVIAGEADASVFGWQAQADRFEDALDTTLNVLPRGGAEVKSESRLVELRLPGPAREQLERTWLPIVREVELGPGVYQAHLAVRERNAGRAGWVQHALEVPAPGTFRLTTPILSDLVQPATGDGGPRITPLARRAFPLGSRLYCSFDVLNAGRNAEGKTQVRAGLVLRRVEGPALSTLAPSELAPAPDGKLNRTLAISLKAASPGPHQLVLTVNDEVTGRTLETVEPFEVTEAMVETAAGEPPAPAPGPPAPVAPPSPGVRMVEPRATLERAVRLERGDGDQARRWGVAAALMMETLGRHEEAAERLRSLAKKAPGDPDVLLALATVEESRIDALSGRAVEVAPAGSESLPQFQRKAARERLLGELESRYRAVLTARPDDREARLRLGRVLQQRGDREGQKHLEEVAKGDGELRALALLFLGQWFDGRGAPREALASYRGALATAPQSQAACLALAQALLRSGDPAGARETVEKGLAVVGLDPYLTYQRPALRLGSALVERLDKEGTR